MKERQSDPICSLELDSSGFDVVVSVWVTVTMDALIGGYSVDRGNADAGCGQLIRQG